MTIDCSSIAGIVSNVEPKPASYISAARKLDSRSRDDLLPVCVSMLASFTTEILHPYIVVEGARRGLRVVPHFCPFNQIEIQALNPASELYQSQPEVVVLALELADVVPDFVWRFSALSKSEIEAEIAKLRERFENLLARIRQNSGATILVFNLSLPCFSDASFADAGLELPQSSAVSRANDALAEACQTEPGAYVFDYARLVAECGLANWYDAKLLSTARIPFSGEAQIALGSRLARYLRALFFPPCKCLVLDLDNTLWGGVLGEEGLGGIALGEDYPGNIFKRFQRRLLSLRDQGVLLAIASKNNEADVFEAFERHPDMVLTLTDFAAHQIHWDDKSTSLKAIASELNLGIDALAFFDDSPVERALIQQHLPEVTVIDVPSSPLHYHKALDESGAFDRLIISQDDRHRAEMIQNSRQRQQFRTQTKSVDEFLKGLNMVATVGELSPATLPRVVQLLAKTNQFNLTTRRHTSAHLQTLVDAGAIVLWMRLKDRFGDNGLVGVAIAVPECSERWRIDTLLLSCRVIGRKAEDALLSELAQRVYDRGCRLLIGEYCPTPSNRQVAKLYPSYGFVCTNDSNHKWELDLENQSVKPVDAIQIEYEETKEHERATV